jgi:hypothetical protein
MEGAMQMKKGSERAADKKSAIFCGSRIAGRKPVETVAGLPAEDDMPLVEYEWDFLQ